MRQSTVTVRDQCRTAWRNMPEMKSMTAPWPGTKAPDSLVQASGEGGNSQLQEAYEVLHRLQALDDALKNTEHEAETPEAYGIPGR